MESIASIIIQVQEPTLIAGMAPHVFDYERIRAMREHSRAHQRVWLDTRPLVGIDPFEGFPHMTLCLRVNAKASAGLGVDS